MNGAIGVDVRFLHEFFLLAGLFNDMSAVPDEGLADLGQVDMWGASLAVSRRTGETTFTLGVTGKLGFGETSGIRFERSADGPAVVDATSDLFQWSLTLFIAGSTVLGDDPDDEPSESPLTEPPRPRAMGRTRGLCHTLRRDERARSHDAAPHGGPPRARAPRSDHERA